MATTHIVAAQLNAITQHLDHLEDRVVASIYDYLASTDHDDFHTTLPLRHATDELRQLIKEINAATEILADQLGV
jgi:hypothetical protein